MIKTTKHLGKKLNDGKQPFLWSYHFTVLFWPVLLGLYTLAYIDCACFKIKSNDSLLLHFLKKHRPTSILDRRPEHGTFTRASPPVLTHKGWYYFVTNKTIKIFSESKQMKHGNGKHLKYSIGSPTSLE